MIIANAAGRACPVCGSEQVQRRFEVRGYPILACRSCGAFFSGEPAAGSDVPATATYGDNYLSRGDGNGAKLSGYFDYEGEMDLHLRNFRKYLTLVRRHSGGNTLLDVGCASGHFLLAASRGGFSAKGLDVSTPSTERARALGFDVWTGDPATIELTERFDVVTLWETIEHLPDPAPVLRQIRRWLKPDGVLMIGTGDNTSLLSHVLGKRWWYLNPPDHTIYYNPRALRIALAQNGFEVDGVYRVWSHLVSSRNAVMKLLRSFQAKPKFALSVARALPDIALRVVHGTTMVVAARPLPSDSAADSASSLMSTNR